LRIDIVNGGLLRNDAGINRAEPAADKEKCEESCGANVESGLANAVLFVSGVLNCLMGIERSKAVVEEEIVEVVSRSR
jgi:hypothetical protein